MKTILMVILILNLLYVSAFSQDRSSKQLIIDSNTQERLFGIITSKKAENEAAHLKLDEIISSWDKLNDLVKREVDQEILESQLLQIEKMNVEISQTSRNNIEAINEVRSDLSIRIPLVKTKPARPEKTTPTGMRSWSEIVRSQNKKSTTPQVSEILMESQQANTQLQQNVSYLLQSLNGLDINLEKLKAERNELEEKEKEVNLSLMSELLDQTDSQTSDMKETLKNILKVLKEDQERKEQMVKMIRM